MPYTASSADQAVDNARRYTSYRELMCLEWVYRCVAAPRTYLGLPDADAAWSRATQKETTGTPPAGAPVYWRIGQHGHIAVSVGGGRVRSTDWPHRGSVSECGIDELSRAWGATYLGWSRDYAGDPIKGLEKPKPAPKPTPAGARVLRRGMVGDDVRRLQVGLLRVFPAYAGPIRTPGGGPNRVFGPNTERVVREFQGRVRMRKTGVVDAATRTQLARYGVTF